MKQSNDPGMESLTKKRRWLITGVAGFIGSNLLEELLKNGEYVVGMDNFSTGFEKNLDDVRRKVGKSWGNFQFINGDIRLINDCKVACQGVDFILHQAALGSVPRSIVDPVATNDTNISGFLNMLIAARDAKIKRFVYAASSSTYGDHPDLPKVEDNIGRPLSPYAVTKYVNELYADVFYKSYGLQCIGLRYFNVFGPRQDPDGAYAAVIPLWISAMIRGQPVVINGDGQTSRDFCYVANVVQANILAATITDKRYEIIQRAGAVFNIAVGQRTTLNTLHHSIGDVLSALPNPPNIIKPIHKSFRAGDVLHSLADISKAEKYLTYKPSHTLIEGLKVTIPFYTECTI